MAQITQRLAVEVITDRALTPAELKQAAQNLELAANTSAEISSGGFWRVPRAERFPRTRTGEWVDQ